jgi:hypothetical protein
MSRLRDQIVGRNGFVARALRDVAGVLVGMLVLWTFGCGSKVADRLPVFPTTGQLKIQGQSPSGAFVVLHPHGMPGKGPDGVVVRPHGVVHCDGTFELTSYETGDGAPAGEYSVTIELRKVVKYPSGDSGPGPNLVPKKFTKPETSTIIVQITEGRNDLKPIVLKELITEKPVAIGRAQSQVVRGL